MNATRRLTLAVLVPLLAAVGCDAQTSPAANTVAPHGGTQSTPRVAFVQESRGNFELKLFNPADQSSVRLELRPEPPQVIIWRIDRAEVITVGTAGVYALRYEQRPVVSDAIGDPAPAGLTPRDGWIVASGEADTGVRVVGAASGQCALYSVPFEGPWQRLASPPPQPAGADDDCDAFAARHRPPTGSVSTAELMRRQQCAAPRSICSTLGDARYAAARSALLKSASAGGLDAVAFADAGATPFYLALGVITGDTPHLSGPVVLVKRDSAALVQPALRATGQVQVSLAGTLALVAAEYSGNDPIVVDLASGKTLMSARGASAAVWVPGP